MRSWDGLGRATGKELGLEKGAAVDGDRASGSGEGEGRRDSGEGFGDNRAVDGNKRQREEEEREEREGTGPGADDWRPKWRRARGIRYAEGWNDETEEVGEGVNLYRAYKIRGKWRMYGGRVEEMIV